MNNEHLKIELRKIHNFEQKGVKLPKRFNIEDRIEILISEHTLFEKTHQKLCEEHYYKTLSHFVDMVKNMNNEPNKEIPYSTAQFEEDLKKWVAETKTT